MGNLKNFGTDEELWKKTENHERWRNVGKRNLWERMEHLKKRKLWGKDGLFNTWNRFNLPVHLEESKIGPYILYKQINYR